MGLELGLEAALAWKPALWFGKEAIMYTVSFTKNY